MTLKPPFAAQVALIVAPLVVYPCILFAGIYERGTDVPPYFAWWNDINPLFFGLNALAVTQWRGYGPVPGPVPETGEDVLELFGLGTVSFSKSCCTLAAVGTAARLLVLLILEGTALYRKKT